MVESDFQFVNLDNQNQEKNFVINSISGATAAKSYESNYNKDLHF